MTDTQKEAQRTPYQIIEAHLLANGAKCFTAHLVPTSPVFKEIEHWILKTGKSVLLYHYSNGGYQLYAPASWSNEMEDDFAFIDANSGK